MSNEEPLHTLFLPPTQTHDLLLLESQPPREKELYLLHQMAQLVSPDSLTLCSESNIQAKDTWPCLRV